MKAVENKCTFPSTTNVDVGFVHQLISAERKQLNVGGCYV
tara:strand:+ start:1071 stop:1190 length:120 start_codon:yes stop_codon:yes gene_type:complete